MSALARFTLVCAGTLAAAVALLGQAQAEPAPSPKSACAVSGTGLDGLLERTRVRLSGRQSLTIVAIGSSSTTGAGARTPAGSYPTRLEVFLKERFRGIPIRVINRGVNGQEDADMVARFERDVIVEKPDLVLWQLGSNAVVRGRPLEAEEMIIREGVERLKATGADVVLIDPQYTPLVIGKSGAEPMVDLIAAEARRQDIGVFRRFELMKDWRTNRHLPFETFSVPDGLHMNEWGYDCFARNLAAAIIASVAPKAVASAPTGTAR